MFSNARRNNSNTTQLTVHCINKLPQKFAKLSQHQRNDNRGDYFSFLLFPCKTSVKLDKLRHLEVKKNETKLNVVHFFKMFYIRRLSLY